MSVALFYALRKLYDAENKPVVYEPGLHFKIPFIENENWMRVFKL